MKVENMREYLIDLIKEYGICDERQHYFTEAEIRIMSANNIKQLYDLCYPNFGERTISASATPRWEF